MGNMMGSYDGHMMGPYGGQMGSGFGQMGPGYGHMGPYAGHMGGSTTGHMTARHDGKNGNFDCPGWDTGNQNTGNHDSGSK